MHPLPDYHYKPAASKTVRLATTAIHGLAIIATLANTLPFSIKAILFSIIATHLGLFLHHCKHLPDYSHVHFSDTEGWRISLNDNPPQPIKLLASSVSTRWLILLHFKTANTAARTLLICRDSLSARHYHHLRLMLKLHFR